MDTTTQEFEMSLFTKSRANQLRDGASTAHGKWQVAAQQCGRKKAWWERDGGTLAEARAVLAAASSTSDPERGIA